MANKEKYLPLGTIVLKKNDIAMYMIIGYLGKNKNGEITDYIMIPFPYGFMAESFLSFLNHDDIEKIVYLGYEDDNFRKIDEMLKDEANEHKKD